MSRHGLTLLLALYLLLAAGFAAVTPFGQAPDESAHALYIQHLVGERALPVLRKERREAYEFHQPPLYYALAAPAWTVGASASPAAGRMAARGVSILIGALGIWLIAALARVVWPGREALALAAAGFTALLPMRLATAASVSNDTLAEAVFTAALLVMLLMLRNGAETRRAAALGVCLGLGVLTKSSDILLFPVALVALLLACQVKREAAPAEGDEQHGTRRRRKAARGPEAQMATAPPRPRLDSRLFLQCAAVTFGVALLIGGGWMARNARLYGDPLGTKAFEQYFQDTPTPEALQQALGYSRGELMVRKVLPLTFVSFWGVFGHMQHFMGAYERGSQPPGWTRILADGMYPPPSWVYPQLLLVTLLAVVGWGVQVFRRSGVHDKEERPGPAPEHPPAARVPDTRTPEHLVLILATFLVVAAFLRFNTEFFQAQGRYLFPAMGPLALCFAGGWLVWLPARGQVVGAAVVLVGMLSLALYALFGTLMPAY
jgi:4-amino-4-deoxy-L-arabinose transferase-like glycosyltransferase